VEYTRIYLKEHESKNVKFSLCLRHEDAWGSGGIILCTLNLGTVPLDRSLGGPQSRSGRGDEDKNS
jgi:hypothetical protein